MTKETQSNGLPVVVLVFANDRTENGDYLDGLRKEERLIRNKLEPLVDLTIDEPIIRSSATKDDFFSTLENRRFRNRIALLHFGGHATGTEIIFEDEAGTPDSGNASILADYLKYQEGLVLFVLNGCSTQDQVRRLRDNGIKAVVATSRGIVDTVAVEFAEAFYSELSHGEQLQRAFDKATQRVRLKRNGPPRGLVTRDLEPTDVSDAQGWPWALDCDPGYEGWRLGEELEPKPKSKLGPKPKPAIEPTPASMLQEFRTFLRDELGPQAFRELLVELLPEPLRPSKMLPSIDEDLQWLVKHEQLNSGFFKMLRNYLPKDRRRLQRFERDWSAATGP